MAHVNYGSILNVILFETDRHLQKRFWALVLSTSSTLNRAFGYITFHLSYFSQKNKPTNLTRYFFLHQLSIFFLAEIERKVAKKNWVVNSAENDQSVLTLKPSISNFFYFWSMTYFFWGRGRIKKCKRK